MPGSRATSALRVSSQRQKKELHPQPSRKKEVLIPLLPLEPSPGSPSLKEAKEEEEGQWLAEILAPARQRHSPFPAEGGRLCAPALWLWTGLKSPTSSSSWPEDSPEGSGGGCQRVRPEHVSCAPSAVRIPRGHRAQLPGCAPMHLLGDLGTAAALWGSDGLLLPPFLLARLKGVFKLTFLRGPCVASVGHPACCTPGLPKKRSDNGGKELSAALSATLKALSSEDTLRSRCPCSSVE